MANSCETCGFELWLPIASLAVADLALYSDGRFPGRCILKLRAHSESLEDLSDELGLDFLRDVKLASVAIRRATGAARVNFAVLGNTVAHVHGHLIPRFPDSESKPGSSPWDDPRPRAKLDSAREDELIAAIRRELEHSNAVHSQ